MRAPADQASDDRPTLVRHNAVEAALAARMTSAMPDEGVVLADRMARLTRELEARRLAVASVIALDDRRRARR